MKILFGLLLFVAIISCKSSKKSDGIADSEIALDIVQPSATCPKHHTDSIIPIIYGFPTEESFRRADSGLVYPGGCDMSSDSPQWYCKIHDQSF